LVTRPWSITGAPFTSTKLDYSQSWLGFSNVATLWIVSGSKATTFRVNDAARGSIPPTAP
jgi:hypothetical protein